MFSRVESGSHSFGVNSISLFFGSPQGKNQKFQGGERPGSMEESVKLHNYVATDMVTINRIVIMSSTISVISIVRLYTGHLFLQEPLQTRRTSSVPAETL